MQGPGLPETGTGAGQPGSQAGSQAGGDAIVAPSGVGKVLEHFAAWLKMHVADAKKIAALEVFTTEVSKDLVKAASAPW